MKKHGKLAKATFLSILGVVTLFYIFVYGFDVEKKIVFDPFKETLPTEKFLISKLKTGYFLSKDNLKISYWYIEGDKNLPAIIYCHGNRQNMTYFQDRIKFLVENGYRVFMFDYRGYGNSEGKPFEQGLYRDLESLLSFVNEEYGIKKDHMILWGHSLGGAVVTDIASRDKFKGVILEGTFTKLEDMKNYAARFKSQNIAEEVINKILYNSIPITQKFESINKVENIKSALLILHSRFDSIVPSWMSKKLAEKN
ncbi:MAG: alpha/beta fold hydrolase, partial [Candidatus Gastranaerophilaceae bacterium]